MDGPALGSVQREAAISAAGKVERRRNVFASAALKVDRHARDCLAQPSTEAAARFGCGLAFANALLQCLDDLQHQGVAAEGGSGTAAPLAALSPDDLLTLIDTFCFCVVQTPNHFHAARRLLLKALRWRQDADQHGLLLLPQLKRLTGQGTSDAEPSLAMGDAVQLHTIAISMAAQSKDLLSWTQQGSANYLPNPQQLKAYCNLPSVQQLIELVAESQDGKDFKVLNASLLLLRWGIQQLTPQDASEEGALASHGEQGHLEHLVNQLEVVVKATVEKCLPVQFGTAIDVYFALLPAIEASAPTSSGKTEGIFKWLLSKGAMSAVAAIRVSNKHGLFWLPFIPPPSSFPFASFLFPSCFGFCCC